MFLHVRCTQLVYWRWAWLLGTQVFPCVQLPCSFLGVFTRPLVLQLWGVVENRWCCQERSSPQLWLNLPLVLDWEPGLLGFRSLLRISDFKKQWKEDPVLSISITKMEEGGGFPLICSQGDQISRFHQPVLTEFWFHFNVPRGLKIWNWPQRILSVIKIHKSLNSRCCRDTS